MEFSLSTTPGQEEADISGTHSSSDEYNADYLMSDDGGRTWSDVKTAHFAKKLRNPQMASVNGCYFMHGRSGSKAKKGEEKGHMVLYSSEQGERPPDVWINETLASK